MAKAYYHNLPTVLCKILGVYTVRYDNKETGKKVCITPDAAGGANAIDECVAMMMMTIIIVMLMMMTGDRQCSCDGEHILPGMLHLEREINYCFSLPSQSQLCISLLRQ